LVDPGIQEEFRVAVSRQSGYFANVMSSSSCDEGVNVMNVAEKEAYSFVVNSVLVDLAPFYFENFL
jgi:hypothetical protein